MEVAIPTGVVKNIRHPIVISQLPTIPIPVLVQVSIMLCFFVWAILFAGFLNNQPLAEEYNLLGIVEPIGVAFLGLAFTGCATSP